MSIFTPLFLAVMPMSIDLGSLLFVIVALSAVSYTCLYLAGPQVDEHWPEAEVFRADVEPCYVKATSSRFNSPRFQSFSISG